MTGNRLKLKTSIPPFGPALISRPRIVERLDHELLAAGGFSRRLTLVSAPAGFGKTTLVREWLDGREDRAAWFSLDQADNEPQRFWTYLIYALRSVKSDLGKGTLAMLQSPRLIQDSPTGSDSLLAPLLNELLDLDNPAYLVLDDYHLVTDPAIHETMAFFIMNMPPTLHLAVATRSDPPWPLPRWRAKKGVVEIRQQELTFSEEEAGRLLAYLCGRHLEQSDLNAVYQKTEGWVTGLQLAAYTLTRHLETGAYIESFPGRDRHVFQFLIEEVLAMQTRDVEEFLLETSILNRFCASLCDAVTRRKDSPDMLARLVNDNLFIIPLDDSGTWFRYHHLFEELLLDQLKNSSPEKVSRLYQKAARWFLEVDEPGEALGYLFKAEDSGKAAQILHQHMKELLQTEGLGLIVRWLDKLPDALMQQYPRLLAYRAVFLLANGRGDEVHSCLELAEKLEFENSTEQVEFTGMLAAVRVFTGVLAGDYVTALDFAEKALRLLPSSGGFLRTIASIAYGTAKIVTGDMESAVSVFWQAYRDSKRSGDLILALAAGIQLAKTLSGRGRLREAEEFCVEMLRFARGEGLSEVPFLGAAWILLGELLREKGELAEAERCIERGFSLSKPEKIALGFGTLFKVIFFCSRRDYNEALKCIGQVESLKHEVELPLLLDYLASTWKARVLLELGELSRAREILSDAGVSDDSPCFLFLENGHLVLAQAALLENNLDQARKILNSIQGLPFYGERKGLIIETLLLSARLEEQSGNPEAAEERLKAALVMGKAAGFYQVFLDRGRELATVLSRVITAMEEDGEGASDRDVPEYARSIFLELSLEHGPSGGKGGRAGMSPGSDPENSSYQELVEELKPREIEILDLISRGFSNRDISEKLYLTVGTVKWYTSNIYGKLGVRSRTRAVARARELNLI